MSDSLRLSIGQHQHMRPAMFLKSEEREAWTVHMQKDKLSTSTFESHSSSHSGSSKTDSSGAQSAEQAKDEDFTKDNAASPIDLECHIQAERITKILDEALYKTKLALCLPQLVRQGRALAAAVPPAHLEDILFIFEQYENPLFSTSLLNMSAMDDLQAGDVTLKNRLNPELGHMIYILNSYPALKPKVDEIVDALKNDYAKTHHMGKPPPPALNYLMQFEHFREQMVGLMENTAGNELRAKFKTRKLEESNAKLICQIKECTLTTKEENKEFEKQMMLKEETIKNLELELTVFSQQAMSKLHKKILDSDRQMVLASRAHSVKRDILQEEQVESQTTYENVLRSNLLGEKNLRGRRIKVETQLMSWLQKYDVEMRDKQVDLDELIKQYDEELELVEKLEKDLAEQDKEFEPLMAEREEEYHAELKDKMEKFMVEHAARIIQVAWRDTLANRAEKKKLKKLQKKMQLAKEAAERAAEIAAKKAAAAAKKAEKEAKLAEKEAKKAEKEAQKAAEKEAAAAAEAAKK